MNGVSQTGCATPPRQWDGWDKAPVYPVRSLAEARSILNRCKDRRVVLLIDGVAGGALWSKALITALRRRRVRNFLPVIDCYDHEGAVMEALAEGLTDILFTGSAVSARKLATMAAQRNANLYRRSKTGHLLSRKQS